MLFDFDFNRDFDTVSSNVLAEKLTKCGLRNHE